VAEPGLRVNRPRRRDRTVRNGRRGDLGFGRMGNSATIRAAVRETAAAV
jgi:hypothetical protein